MERQLFISRRVIKKFTRNTIKVVLLSKKAQLLLMSISKVNQVFGLPQLSLPPFQIPGLTQSYLQKFQKFLWIAQVIFKIKGNWAAFLPFLLQTVCIYITIAYPIVSYVIFPHKIMTYHLKFVIITKKRQNLSNFTKSK